MATAEASTAAPALTAAWRLNSIAFCSRASGTIENPKSATARARAFSTSGSAVGDTSRTSGPASSASPVAAARPVTTLTVAARRTWARLT